VTDKPVSIAHIRPSDHEAEVFRANLNRLVSDVLPFLFAFESPMHLARVCRRSAEAIKATIELEDLISQDVLYPASNMPVCGHEGQPEAHAHRAEKSDNA